MTEVDVFKDRTLNEDNVPDVVCEILDVRTKSEIFGRVLKLPAATVESIHQQYSDPKNRLFRVIDEFVKQVEPPPTWRIILEALRNPLIDHSRLAQDIERKHCPLLSLQHEVVKSSHQGPHPPQTTSVPGSAELSLHVPQSSQQVADVPSDVGQIQVDPAILKEEVQMLKKKFKDLKKKIRECLDRREVPVTDVVDELTLLSPDDDECHKLFLEGHVKELYASSSNTVLFGNMNFHWNYLDPSLLNHLVTERELVEVKPDMTKYQSDLQQFRMKTPLSLFCQTQNRKKVKISPEFKKMVAEFELPNNVTLEILERFRKEYASHYQLHKFAMMVADVQFGSFIITWLIPESVVDKLKGKVPVQIFRKYSVTTLTIAGVCVYCDKTEMAPDIMSPRVSPLSLTSSTSQAASKVEESSDYLSQGATAAVPGHSVETTVILELVVTSTLLLPGDAGPETLPDVPSKDSTDCVAGSAIAECNIVKAGRGCGSGLVFQFEQTFWSKLLQQPSCLLQKYGLNTFRSQRFYVLLTAHSNIYGQDREKEQSVKKYIEEGEISLAFGDGSSGRRVALRDCVARTTEDGSGRCVAVTCCGADSILVLGSQNVSLTYTLKSHSSPENCSIDSNFLLLFLKAEVVDKHRAECNPPPSLREPKVAELAELGAEMLWRDESGVVQKPLALALSPTHSRHVETKSLTKKEEQARKLQTIDVTTEMAESSCYIGAPIVHSGPGGSPTIIGFYSGQNKMTTIYGIFSLLKGGVEYFLAAMNAKQTTSTDTLITSRWEYHITGFLKGIHTRCSILDLLHFLLRQDDVRQVPILMCDLEGSPRSCDIIAALNILTSIFRRYKDLEGENPTEDLAKPCGEDCGCLGKITEILMQHSRHFARSDGQNSDIVEALFQCVEKMQHFNYMDIAEKTLKEIRTDLDELGKKNDSSDAVNKSFKWIDILNRERACKSSNQQATNNEPGSLRFVY